MNLNNEPKKRKSLPSHCNNNKYTFFLSFFICMRACIYYKCHLFWRIVWPHLWSSRVKSYACTYIKMLCMLALWGIYLSSCPFSGDWNYIGFFFLSLDNMTMFTQRTHIHAGPKKIPIMNHVLILNPIYFKLVIP